MKKQKNNFTILQFYNFLNKVARHQFGKKGVSENSSMKRMS